MPRSKSWLFISVRLDPLLPNVGTPLQLVQIKRMCSPSYTSSMKDRLVNNLLDVTLQGEKVIIIKLSENGRRFSQAVSLLWPLLEEAVQADRLKFGAVEATSNTAELPPGQVHEQGMGYLQKKNKKTDHLTCIRYSVTFCTTVKTFLDLNFFTNL